MQEFVEFIFVIVLVFIEYTHATILALYTIILLC